MDNPHNLKLIDDSETPIDWQNITYTVVSLEEARQQQQNYLSLTSRGIPTYEIFKFGTNDRGEVIRITEDRSNQGQRWTYYLNQIHNLNLSEYFSKIFSMDQQVRTQLINNTFDIAINASQSDKDGKCILFHKKDRMMNPLMIDFNPSNTNDVKIIVGNVHSLVEELIDSNEAAIINIRYVYHFLSGIIGFFDSIPKDHKASKYKCFSKDQLQGFKESEKWFKDMIYKNNS